MSQTIDWPWQYNFPPFFTIQSNENTRRHQLDAWCQLVLSYSKANRQCVIDIRNSNIPLFRNGAINRALNSDGILAVMRDLERSGHAEPCDKALHRWYVFWEPLDQISSSIYTYVTRNGMTGSVCTFFELTQGEGTEGESFHGLDDDVLEKALQKLEIKKKVELMEIGDSKGVKFF